MSGTLLQKENGAGIEDEDCPAFQIGRAVHTMVLEGGDAFDRTYAIGGPINPRTGKSFGSTSQAYQDCLSTKEFEYSKYFDWEGEANILAQIKRLFKTES